MKILTEQLRVSKETKFELHKISLEWTFRDHKRWTIGDVVQELLINFKNKESIT